MKKTFISFALATLVAVAYAGGAGSAATQSDQDGVYIEGLVGSHYHVNYKSAYSESEWTHAAWSWALGVDVGYQINRFWSAELGGFWTQRSANKNNKNRWLQDSFAYLSAKLSIPVMDNIDLFTKFGLGVNHWRLSYAFRSQPAYQAFRASYDGLVPVFALGGAYRLGSNHQMAFSLQYMRFGQSWNYFSDLAHASMDANDMVTIGFSYRFAV